MAKVKTQFRCEQCQTLTPKWSGRCGSCGEWNSVIQVTTNASTAVTTLLPTSLTDVSIESNDRLTTNCAPIDALLGGGVVPGSVLLLGGEPGAGKSTLSLQLASALSSPTQRALVISGEESLAQLAQRAKRLGIADNNIAAIHATDVEQIAVLIRNSTAPIVVIDSVQMLSHPDLSSAPGSVTAVRECTAILVEVAKTTNVALCLVGHVTKDGSLAGPRTLEHMVDVVLLLEGDRHHELRFLRAVKNRFGPVGELVAFEHTSEGLEVVADPSALLLRDRRPGQVGSSLGVLVDGRQPFVVELQALVAKSPLPSPRRGVDGGLDAQRLHRLLAVIEQHVGMVMHNVDVFASSIGDLACDDPGVDLPLLLALASAYSGKPIAEDTIAIGEVGLGGDVRAVAGIDSRLRTAKELGLTCAIVPKGTPEIAGMTLIQVDSVSGAVAEITAKRTQSGAVA